MDRMSIITLSLGFSAILLMLLANAFLIEEYSGAPEVDAVTLEEVNPTIENSFVSDLKERSANSVGIELEL